MAPEQRFEHIEGKLLEQDKKSASNELILTKNAFSFLIGEIRYKHIGMAIANVHNVGQPQ